MLPILQIGSLAIPTYPLALVLAGWVGLEVGSRVARRLGLDGDHIYNAGLYALLTGLIASRLGHVIAFWPAYRTQPLEIVGLNTRALLPWPGVAAALIVAGWYVYRRKLPWAAMLDAAATGALAAIAVASLGAFLGGENIGAVANAPWAVSFWGVKRHPAQIYEALAAVVVLAATLSAVRRSAGPGAAAWLAALGYGLSRWLLEPFRADSAMILNGVRAWQAAGLALALIALWALRGRIGSGGRTEEG
jgi:phosphatidylglycerol:prolipoprotein diacylglycerol transferase